MFETNQLVIVGGPSAVGKSTLMYSMQRGNNPILCNQIFVFNPSTYVYLDASYVCEMHQSFVDRAIIHYDFIRQYSPKGGFAHLPDLISRSKNVCTLTLGAPASILLHRISSRLEQVKNSTPHAELWIRHLQRKEDMYRDLDKLLEEYDRWFAFIEECGVARHLIIDSANSYQFTSPSDKNEARKILKNTLTGITA